MQESTIEGIGEQIAGRVANLGEKIVAPIQQALEAPDEDELPAVGVSVSVNRNLRRKLYSQHYVSNRFVGTAIAQEVETQYQAFVTQYQLQKVRLRLCGFAICLVGLTFPQGFSKEEKFPHIVWRSFVPSSSSPSPLRCARGTAPRSGGGKWSWAPRY